jgi:hypothetical protein
MDRKKESRSGKGENVSTLLAILLNICLAGGGVHGDVAITHVKD